MKKKIKWIIISLILIASVTAMIYVNSQPMEVEGILAEPKTAELFFTEQGIAEAERVVDVYSLVSGEIVSLNVSENQKINKGDLICVIDSADLEFQILQAQSNIKSYEAQIRNLDETERKEKDSLNISKNELLGQMKALEAEELLSEDSNIEFSKTKDEQLKLQNQVVDMNRETLRITVEDLKKAEILFKNGILPESEYKKASDAVNAAKNALEQSEQQLAVIKSGETQNREDYYRGMKDSLNAQIAGIDSSLGKSYSSGMKQYYNALIESSAATIAQLERTLDNYQVKAEASGIITSLNIKDTNVVNTQIPVASITPEGKVRVEVYVSTNDIDAITAGDEVELILKRRDGDKAHTGKVSEIEQEAVIKMSSLGVEERRVKVIIDPVTGLEDIKTGYDMDVKFNIYHEENKITVPKTALFVVDDKDMVWVKADGRAEMREVKKGMELRTDFVIEDGISPGEFIISVADTKDIKEGASIK